MSKGFLILFYFAFLILSAESQDSTRLSFSAYGEVYYNQDFSKPLTHTRPLFVYSHNRTGEININLGLLKVSFVTEKTRANLGIMTGTYSNANLAGEPGVLKNLYEANAGVRISKQHQLWIDAGVLPSHIGFESAIGKDNWTLTRSLAADNSPYYEAGVRLSYNSPNKKWVTALLLLNGWQRIQRVAGNHTPAFGTQATFKPTDNFLINSSTFIGSDQPDSARKMRYFHNLYSVIQLNNWIGITVGLDVGLEQKFKGSSSMDLWYTPVVIFRMKVADNKYLGLRTEYYQDKSGVIVTNINGNPQSLCSYSSNFDWSLNQYLLWRIESKWMKSKNPTFLRQNGAYDRSNWTASTALCFLF